MTDTPASGDHAQLDWDDQGQPLSRAFGDVYFSRADGLAETRHVFLQHNRLAERFALQGHRPFIIAETGFGSGLNFLAAWQLWEQCAPADARLEFITTEKYPLKPADLARALALWPELATYAEHLLAAYPALLVPGIHRLVLAPSVGLTLMIGDAADSLGRLCLGPGERIAHPVDAWFLDGFAPAKNPQMWSPDLFAALARLSGPGTTAATFSAAGVVKQGLRGAGFQVKRVPGFGRKRDMVAAQVPSGAAPDRDHQASEPPVAVTHTDQRGTTPWHRIRHYTPAVTQTALVIGGGLAGCHIARALAERGWQVQLLEREHRLAQGASGNPQGIVYARLSPRQETLASFNLACLQYALRHYRPYWAENRLGQACGVLQLADSPEEARLQAALAPQLTGAEALARPVDALEASKLAGVDLALGGLYFPGAGWLDPAGVCEALATHPRIERHLETRVMTLTHEAGGWQARVTDAQGRSRMVAQASVAIIANGRDALDFSQTRKLPLKSIRGQVSYLPATDDSRTLRTVICGDGYLAPAFKDERGEWHCAGASFNLQDDDTRLRAADHAGNLARLNPLVPGLLREWGELSPETLSGRVAFRCTSPDYLPLVGPVPIDEDFVRDYQVLRQDAKRTLPLAGSYWPGLYLSLAYGSRGLAYTPLCAGLLAAQINDEPLPLPESLVAALNPARFIIRGLKRKRV